MKQKRMSTRIQTIRQAGSSTPGLPGNFLVNVPNGKKAVAENWFNSREIRNALLGAGFSPRIPCILLVGATLTFTRLEIEPTDLPADKSGFKFEVNGREITYKQVGVHNVGLDIDVMSLSPERLEVLSDLSMKHARQQFTPAPAASTNEVEKKEEITEITPLDETAGTEGTDIDGTEGKELETVETDLVNASQGPVVEEKK